MKIFLIRHGETDFNREARIQGSIETELNQNGAKQSELLAKKLPKYLDTVDVCFVSPQKRAIQTSEILLNEFSKIIKVHKIIIEPLIKEINCGKWEGKLVSDIEKEEPYLLNLIRTRVDIPYPEGESILDVRERVKKFYKSYLEPVKENSKNILIISHGNFLRTFASYILDLAPEFAIKIVLQNTGFSLIEKKLTTPPMYKMIFWNNLEHLE